MGKRNKRSYEFKRSYSFSCHGNVKNKFMRQTATECILRHLLAGALDKQVMLQCLNYCWNIFLCVTWQGTCYIFCALEQTALKDKPVCLSSEFSSVLSKSSLQTSLWNIFGHNDKKFAILFYIYKCIYIYIYTHTRAHTLLSI